MGESGRLCRGGLFGEVVVVGVAGVSTDEFAC